MDDFHDLAWRDRDERLNNIRHHLHFRSGFHLVTRQMPGKPPIQVVIEEDFHAARS